MTYRIINTGSDGNGVSIDNTILIDCGITFGQIESFYKELQLVLLTHIHSDHFNKFTIKRLTKLRPTLRFACGEWLKEELKECGVNEKNIDVLEMRHRYAYGSLEVEPFELHHDVEQCGWKVFKDGKKLIYATDTKKIDHIVARDFDYYLIEANYKDEEELRSRSDNEIYIKRVLNTHLSEEAAAKWLLQNMNDDSTYEFLHFHKEKELSKRFINIKPLIDKVSNITGIDYELSDNGIYSALNDILTKLEEDSSDGNR